MRCTNCGWENPDGSIKCEKCNASLSSGGSSSSPYGSTLRDSVPGSTIREDGPFTYDKPTGSTILTGGTIPTGGTSVDPTFCPPNNSPKGQPTGETINPYGMGGGFVPIAYCKLSPVIFPGENPRHTPKDVSIKGDTELNRDNLDPDNPAITSKVQAVLTNKNGKWYIQDKSFQKTTFVHAEEPIPLNDGDVILMGNRTFIFNED